MKIFDRPRSISTDFDAHQFAHPHRGIEQQLEHDLVLYMAAVLDYLEEPLQFEFGKSLGQLALLFRRPQAKFLTALLRDVEKITITEQLARRVMASQKPPKRVNFVSANETTKSEVWRSLSGSLVRRGFCFAFYQFCEML